MKLSIRRLYTISSRCHQVQKHILRITSLNATSYFFQIFKGGAHSGTERYSSVPKIGVCSKILEIRFTGVFWGVEHESEVKFWMWRPLPSLVPPSPRWGFRIKIKAEYWYFLLKFGTQGFFGAWNTNLESDFRCGAPTSRWYPSSSLVPLLLAEASG